MSLSVFNFNAKAHTDQNRHWNVQLKIDWSILSFRGLCVASVCVCVWTYFMPQNVVNEMVCRSFYFSRSLVSIQSGWQPRLAILMDVARKTAAPNDGMARNGGKVKRKRKNESNKLLLFKYRILVCVCVRCALAVWLACLILFISLLTITKCVARRNNSCDISLVVSVCFSVARDPAHTHTHTRVDRFIFLLVFVVFH